MSVKQIFNTSAELDYPTVLPTLDLDFANSKTLDPRITFTRSSGGSYVGADGLIKLAGVNEARFDHDPYTGESLGLLIEESRTNLLTFSGIPSANWNANNSAVLTNNSSTSPDGTTNATQIAGAALTDSGIFRTFSLTSGTAYTYSLFVKAVSGSNTMYFGTDAGTNATVQVNTFTGVASLRSGSPTNITSTSYPNGWYRISFTFTASVTAVHSFVIYTLTTNANTWLAWGAQIEEGSFPTSYIPTVASTRTRAADNASITGKNFSEWYRQDEGTFVSNSISRGIFGVDGYNRVYDLSDGTSLNEIGLIRLLNSNVSFYEYITTNNVTPLFQNFSTDNNIPILHAMTFRQNYFYRVVKQSNGTKLIYNTNIILTIPSLNRIGIGCEFRTSQSRQLNGTISKLTYYPKVLTPSQLQTLTS